MDTNNNGERRRLTLLVEGRERLLLYGVVLIVAMLSWFFVLMWGEISRVSNTQAERRTRVEEIPQLREELKQLRLQMGNFMVNDGEIKRQAEAIRRLEDRFETLRGSGRGRMDLP